MRVAFAQNHSLQFEPFWRVDLVSGGRKDYRDLINAYILLQDLVFVYLCNSTIQLNYSKDLNFCNLKLNCSQDKVDHNFEFVCD